MRLVGRNAAILRRVLPAAAPAGFTPTTWDASNKNSQIALSGSDLIATLSASTPDADATVKTLATLPATGLFYFEADYTSNAVGQTIIGLAQPGLSNSTWVGSTGNTSAGMNSNGRLYRNGGNSLFLSSVASGKFAFAVNRTASLMWVARIISGARGLWMGSATADPVTLTEGYDISALGSGVLHVAGTMEHAADTITANFGATAFDGAALSGYQAGVG